MHLKSWQSILSSKGWNKIWTFTSFYENPEDFNFGDGRKGISYFYSDLLAYSHWFLRNLVITPCSYRKLICHHHDFTWFLSLWYLPVEVWGKGYGMDSYFSGLSLLHSLSCLRNFKLKTEMFSVYMGFVKTIFTCYWWPYCETCFLLFWRKKKERHTSSLWTEERRKFISHWHCITSP